METNKPFPILNLPLLVSRKVWNGMEPSEVFIASYCSARTRSVVKYTWRSRKTDTVIDVDENKDVSCCITDESGKRCVLKFGMLSSESNRQLMLSPDVILPMDFNQSKCQFNCKDGNLPLHLVHQRMCDIFSVKTDAIHIAHPHIPQMMCPGAVTKSHLTSILRIDELEKYFNLQPNHSVAIINPSSVLSRPPVRRSSFLQVKNLKMDQSCHWAIQALNHFRGEHLILVDAWLEQIFIKNFFLKFMTKREQSEVKSILAFMRKPIHHFDVDGILKAWKVYEYNGSEVPSKFEYDSELKKYHEFAPGTFDYSEAHHYKRPLDGKLVSVKLSMRQFLVFIWDN